MDKLDIDFSFIDDQEDAECVIRARYIEKLEKESAQNRSEWQAKSIKNKLFQSEISEMVLKVTTLCKLGTKA